MYIIDSLAMANNYVNAGLALRRMRSSHYHRESTTERQKGPQIEQYLQETAEAYDGT